MKVLLSMMALHDGIQHGNFGLRYGKADKELLSAGTVLTAEGGEPTAKFTVDGKPVSADLLRPLGLLIRPHTHRNAISFDHLFGTAVPRQIGDIMDWIRVASRIATFHADCGNFRNRRTWQRNIRQT